METLRIVGLILLLLMNGTSYSPKYFNKHFGVSRSSTLMRETVANPISEIIDPATYSPDLYKILGVSPNATRIELRDAYWAIAYLNHPDKNDSQTSLEIFRNASYAYKILGRDPKVRNEYDKTLKTKQFFDALGEVGSEVVYPLAFDVALPLINITINSIGSFAVPFLRDAIEQSTAVVKAAFQNNDEQLFEETDTSLDMLAKTTQNVMKARELVDLEQRIRRMVTQLDDVEMDIIRVERKLAEAKTNQVETEKIMVDCTTKCLDLDMKTTIATRNMSNIMESYLIIKEEETNAESLYQTKQSTLQEFIIKSNQLSSSIEITKKEIEALEAALLVARTRLKSQTAEYTVITNEITPTKAIIEYLQSQKVSKTSQRVSISSDLQIAEEERGRLQSESDRAQKLRKKAEEAHIRQKEYTDIMEKKLVSLITKKITLQEKYKQTMELLDSKNSNKQAGSLTSSHSVNRKQQASLPSSTSTSSPSSDFVEESSLSPEEIELMKKKLEERNAALLDSDKLL